SETDDGAHRADRGRVLRDRRRAYPSDGRCELQYRDITDREVEVPAHGDARELEEPGMLEEHHAARRIEGLTVGTRGVAHAVRRGEEGIAPDHGARAPREGG